MLLAEALAEKTDAQRRLSQLQSRIAASVKHFEGEEPEEDASQLLAQARALVTDIAWLVSAVARTNAVAVLTLDSGEQLTIAEAIARREALAQTRKVVVGAVEAARPDRYSRSRDDIRQVTAATLDLPALRREADELAKQYRKLDVALQAANFSTQLVEG